MPGVPVGARLLAAFGAVVVGAWFGVLTPLTLQASGYPLTAAALVASVVPLVLFLALLAAAPDFLQRLLRRWTRLDLHDAGHVAAGVIMAGTLWFVLGYGSLVNGTYAYESIVLRGEEAPAISGDGLLQGLTLNLILLVLPPLFYVAFTGAGGPAAALRALGFRMEGAGRAVLAGFGVALLCIAVLAVAGAAVERFDVAVPENERALEIARSVSILGAFGIAVGAAVSEEVFFRGFLQPRVGLLAQAVLFSIAHLSYVNVLQVVVTFALGLLFGILYARTRNIWAPIAAHFLFNFIMLVAAMYAPDVGSG